MEARLGEISGLMHAASGLDAAIDLLRQAGEVIGMTLPAVIDDVSGNTPALDRQGRRLVDLFGWPAWMADRWYSRAYTGQHPIYLRCRFEDTPFASTNAQMWTALEPLTSAQQHMRDDLEEFGVYGSLAVPVHLSLGRTAAVVWASRETLDIDRIVARCGHHLLAIGHGFMTVLQPEPLSDLTAVDLAYLTDRQIECLSWLASGKTILETATILDISTHTVREHLRAVTARLNAANTPHAVALACQLGIIGPLRR